MDWIRGEGGLRRLAGPCAVTVGGFDGLHLGHRAIIERLQRVAEARGLPTAVVLFEPLPTEFFARADNPPPRLYRLRERARIIERLGVDCLVCLRFSQALADCPARDFVERVLVGGLRARALVVGHDFRFGKDRGGDFTTLRESGACCGFETEQVAAVEHAGARVSCTRIRNALLVGDVALANRLLGRRFGVVGRVVAGRGLGAQLGFPTANVACGRRPPPLAGVYAAAVDGDSGETFDAVVNAGFRPTVEGTRRAAWRLEAHLLDFAGDLYGRRVTVRPLCKLRDEKKFASLAELRVNVALDVATARRWFDERAPAPRAAGAPV